MRALARLAGLRCRPDIRHLTSEVRSAASRCFLVFMEALLSGAGLPGFSAWGAPAPAHGRAFHENAFEIKREKGVWRMPWRREAKKDVAGCEKLRGVASRL
jgi:hypothetical protein